MVIIVAGFTFVIAVIGSVIGSCAYKALIARQDRDFNDLTTRLYHIENKEKAEALIAEARKFHTEIFYYYEAGSIWSGHNLKYSLEDFECKVLCDLRKKKTTKKSRPDTYKKKVASLKKAYKGIGK